MTREEATRLVVEVLYGAPGEDHDTPQGRELLLGLLEELGLAALTDEAVVRLAQRHREADGRQA